MIVKMLIADDQGPRHVTESANVPRIFATCRKHRETKRGLRSSGTERRVQHSSAAHQKEGPDRASKTRIGDEQAAFPRHCFDVLAMREKS
jgi:hypothetical protein